MPGQIHRIDVQLRFSDTDALGHVNNASFATYAEVGRLEFLGGLGGPVQSLILASLQIDFRRQVKIGEAVHVDSWVERIGNSSITLGQTIVANGERAADVSSAVVYFDYAANKPMTVPDALRARLEPFLK